MWTPPKRIEAEGHENDLRTSFLISDFDYEAELDDLLFAKPALDSIPASRR